MIQTFLRYLTIRSEKIFFVSSNKFSDFITLINLKLKKKKHFKILIKLFSEFHSKSIYESNNFSLVLNFKCNKYNVLSCTRWSNHKMAHISALHLSPLSWTRTKGTKDDLLSPLSYPWREVCPDFFYTLWSFFVNT